MALYYSAAAHGFFDDRLHADLPADAQLVTAARHRELMIAQAAGAAIEAGDNGKPRLRRPSVSIAARRVALIRQVKREASRRITAIAPIWQQLNDIRFAATVPPLDRPGSPASARFDAIDAVRAASDTIEAQISAADDAALAALDIANHPAWPKE
ncbi:hypothetical protein AYR46_01635 [Sphingobium yanoikuyae]|uniref:hypothetical protein n=1 Tax=Sphingobium yanoikuyae TaxID=13690 RepID=UPI0007A75286|nr:hypothetical protein [Sphingobium yanoikuyae]KZC83309.1 hypothetical protein AYR46_01635 [Sphingobium yanoikuyae]